MLAWKNRAKAMVKRHLGAETGSHAGADVPTAAVLSRPLSGCQLPSWPLQGGEGLLEPFWAENWAAGANQTMLHKQRLPRLPGLGAEKQCQMVPSTGC